MSGATRAGRSPGEAAAMADDMFAKYVDLVAEDPAQHAMDYVHSYAHAEKA